MNNKILVTGGTGYIGSHTCVELIQEGYEVVIFDNLSNSKESVLNKIKEITGIKPIFYHGDVLNTQNLQEIFQKEQNIKAVIHFAGLKAVGESVEKPLWYYQNNITGILKLLEVMEDFNCKNILFSSSATVYGEQNPIPYTEDMQTSATSPYGYSKVVCERILQDHSHANPQVIHGILRYFNPIGAHPSGLIGENPQGIPNNLMPYLLQVATGQREKLFVYGNDYPTLDGTGVRDYVHVVDLAKGHVAALKYLLEEEKNLVVNLGTGTGTSVLEVVQELEKACKKTIPLEFTNRRQGDIAEFYADTQKAKELLQWKARKSLSEMCSDGWNFANHQNNNL